MTYMKVELIKRFCKRKQVMCEYANELACCKVTVCVYPSNFPKTYTSNRTNYKGGDTE